MRSRWLSLSHPHTQVWLFAIGYFISYIPYSALARAMTQGYLTPGQGPVSGLDILPTTLFGTILTMPLLITTFGGFHFTATRRILGYNAPFPRIDTLLSGIGFAAIITTTTLAYSFAGISIVLALVLMRAGVLTIAPVVDVIARREVHPYSWIALVLSFLAIGVALSQVGKYELTIAAAANLALYLCGYFIRLNMMSHYAKTSDEAVNRRFVAEECIVAMLALGVIAVLIALVHGCDGAATLGDGLTVLTANVPSLLTGIAYGFLGIFATLIYLNRLENTFAIPVFCCASLLSGLVASLALAWLFAAPPLRGADFVSSGLIMLAGVVLYVRNRPQRMSDEYNAQATIQRLLLFVCSSNTIRSPIAQAICHAEIVRRLLQEPTRRRLDEVQVASAGITAKTGEPMTREAQRALQVLGVPVPQHTAHQLSAELIERASAIICMTNQQRETVLAIDPSASVKVHRLHPFRDLDDPAMHGPKALLRMSRQIQHLVTHRLSYFLNVGGV
jgi:protein-tyrosine-phosphatase